MLLHHLPRDSATVRAVGGPEAEWGLQEQLLAIVGDAVRAGNWQRSGDKKIQRPDPIPRPGVGPVRAGITRDEMRARLLEQRSRLQGR